MALEALWTHYQQHGYAGMQYATPESALDHFYLALIAFQIEDMPQAAALARIAASAEPHHPVFAQSAIYLDRVLAEGKASVYVDGEAFAAFIRGGGNIRLYDSLSKALRATYDEYETLSLLDIGVGDGLALLPALTPSITQLDLIEPSGAMLGRTTAQLRAWNVSHRPHATTLQDFMRRESGPWDVIQATWSLQSIAPEERPAVFAWLRAHGHRILIAEFDVPHFEDMLAPDRVRYIVDHYWRGLHEYEDGELVAQGFLMPVMFGYFDRSAARTNWEGPLTLWQSELNAAGFTRIKPCKLFAYFWADAYLIDAR